MNIKIRYNTVKHRHIHTCTHIHNSPLILKIYIRDEQLENLALKGKIGLVPSLFICNLTYCIHKTCVCVCFRQQKTGEDIKTCLSKVSNAVLRLSKTSEMNKTVFPISHVSVCVHVQCTSTHPHKDF